MAGERASIPAGFLFQYEALFLPAVGYSAVSGGAKQPFFIGLYFIQLLRGATEQALPLGQTELHRIPDIPILWKEYLLREQAACGRPSPRLFLTGGVVLGRVFRLLKPSVARVWSEDNGT